MARRREERAENKNQNSLPKIDSLPGTVCVQKVRCGKTNCKCAKGLLHEGYYYRFYYEHGKLCKKYVKKCEVERIKRACLLYKQERADMRMMVEAYKRDWRRLKQLLKEWGF